MAIEGYSRASTSLYKGNDIDTNGDGIVNEADSANLYKGNDIDTDGDGVVDKADNALAYDGVSPADGTAGQFLETDGTAASWGDPSTSGGNIPTGTIAIWSGDTTDVPSGWVICDGANGTPDLRDKFVVGAGNSYTAGATGGAQSVTLSQSQLANHSHGGNVQSADAHAAGATTGGSSFSGTTGSTDPNSDTSQEQPHSDRTTSGTSQNHTHQVDTWNSADTVTIEEGTSGTLTTVAGTETVNQTSGNPSVDHTHEIDSGAHSHAVTDQSHDHSFSIDSHDHSVPSGNHSHGLSIDSVGSGSSIENRPPYHALVYIQKT